jgi:hypothetical protein
MGALRTVVGEFVGLFVDDGSLVGAVIALVIAIALLLSGALVDPGVAAVLLGVGVAALLAENVVRFARAAAAKPQR